jgi:dolichyl-phosphate-mannose-protein mannosyltransferase
MQSESRTRRIARRAMLAGFCVTLAWSVWLAVAGGFDGVVLGIRIRSNNPRRVFVASVGAFIGYILTGGVIRMAPLVGIARSAVATVARHPGWVALALAATAVSATVVLGARIAGGADAYGYVSQADLWLARDLKVSQPWVDQVPWPNAKWTFTPLGYRPMSGESAIVPTYSPGLPILMAIAKWVGGQCALFAVVPLSLGLSLLTTYALGKRLVSAHAGLMAAWFLATSPVVLEVSLESLSDVPVMAAWSTAFYFLLDSSVWSAASAGLLASVAILIRPNLVPLVIPMAAWYLVRRAAGEASTRSRLVHLAVFILTVLPGVALVSGLNSHLYGSAFTSGYGSLADMFSWAHVLPNLRRFIAWIVETQTPLALLGIAALIVPLRRIWPAVADRRLFVIIAMFVALLWAQYSAYLEFDSPGYLRFLLPGWPFMMVGLAAVLVAAGRAHPRVGPAAAIGIASFLGLWSLHVANGRDVFEQRQAARHEAPIGRLVREHTTRNSVVLAVHRSGSVRYYAGRMTLRYDMLDGDWLDRAVAWLSERDVHVYALLDEREAAETKQRFAGQKRAEAFDRPVLTYRPASTSLYDLSTPPDRSKPTRVIADPLEDLPGCDPPRPLPGLQFHAP